MKKLKSLKKHLYQKRKFPDPHRMGSKDRNLREIQYQRKGCNLKVDRCNNKELIVYQTTNFISESLKFFKYIILLLIYNHYNF